MQGIRVCKVVRLVVGVIDRLTGIGEHVKIEAIQI